MSIVVHCKKSKYDVYIGRPSIWGNPFVIGNDGSRAEVISKYKSWLLTGESFQNKEATEYRRQLILTNLPKLQGKVLGCWCSPQSCHGDVLKELLNE